MMVRDWSTTFHRSRHGWAMLVLFTIAWCIPAFSGILIAKPYLRQQRIVVGVSIALAGCFAGVIIATTVEDALGIGRRRRLIEALRKEGFREVDHWEGIELDRRLRPVGAKLEPAWAAGVDDSGRVVLQIRLRDTYRDGLGVVSHRLEAPLPVCAILNVGENDWLYKPLAGVRAAHGLVESAGSAEIRSDDHLVVSAGLRALAHAMRPGEAVIVEAEWLHVLWVGPLTEEGMRQLIARPLEWLQALQESHP